jgi:hypothetical protein
VIFIEKKKIKNSNQNEKLFKKKRKKDCTMGWDLPTTGCGLIIIIIIIIITIGGYNGCAFLTSFLQVICSDWS